MSRERPGVTAAVLVSDGPAHSKCAAAFTEGDIVRWNTNGSKFAVICNNELTVYGLVRPCLPLRLVSRKIADIETTPLM